MADQLGVAVAVLAGFLALPVRAEVSGPSAIVTPAQPQWTELTVEQKIVLAPLSDDWDALESNRQKKWLGIVRRFASMTPAEQRRIQTQMQEWGKLTPAQRALARENFITASQLPAEKKEQLRQKWEEYSNLPEEEKDRLKKQVAGKPVPKPGHAPLSALPAGVAHENQPGSATGGAAKDGSDGVAAVPSSPPGNAAVSATEAVPAGGAGDSGR
jgi:hypothetical protein